MNATSYANENTVLDKECVECHNGVGYRCNVLLEQVGVDGRCFSQRHNLYAFRKIVFKTRYGHECIVDEQG